MGVEHDQRRSKRNSWFQAQLEQIETKKRDTAFDSVAATKAECNNNMVPPESHNSAMPLKSDDSGTPAPLLSIPPTLTDRNGVCSIDSGDCGQLSDRVTLPPLTNAHVLPATQLSKSVANPSSPKVEVPLPPPPEEVLKRKSQSLEKLISDAEELDSHTETASTEKIDEDFHTCLEEAASLASSPGVASLTSQRRRPSIKLQKLQKLQNRHKPNPTEDSEMQLPVPHDIDLPSMGALQIGPAQPWVTETPVFDLTQDLGVPST